MSDDTIYHANKYDGIVVWCETSKLWDPGHEIEYSPEDDMGDVTCLVCLEAMKKFGQMAASRLEAISAGSK